MGTRRRPIDVPTAETVRFIAAELAPGASLLEVGCGTGEVARELAALGHQVLAVDADREAVDAARALGVEAVLAEWPEFACPPVDAVLFSRSLHHLHDLDGSIRAASNVLRLGGRLLVEDLAFGAVDERAVRWFSGVVRTAAADGRLLPVPGEFATILLTAPDPVAAWHEAHRDLHPLEAMLAAIAGAFEIRDVVPVPYLYRYLVPVAASTEEAAGWVASVLDEEVALGGEGKLALVGRRVRAGLKDEG